ncbi:Major facilitator superfamily protein [Giardia muris]|uniref:Major facilitator superfamily protein n=1 Tax=Giardia muris TaxID=5742 RepID=A0A4Z1SV79_GIAMU|nr:Major facilitator superfamily protein [Giardia muris]|eukprot:TNJ29570.1 Major facilitator superfamily protein [Giardia muris]
MRKTSTAIKASALLLATFAPTGYYLTASAPQDILCALGQEGFLDDVDRRKLNGIVDLIGALLFVASGFLIDLFEAERVIGVFISLALAGYLVFSVCIVLHESIGAYIGMGVFTMAGRVVPVCSNVIAYKFIDQAHLSVAMGAIWSAVCASVFISPILSNTFMNLSLMLSLWLGLLPLTISEIPAIVLVVLYYKYITPRQPLSIERQPLVASEGQPRTETTGGSSSRRTSRYRLQKKQLRCFSCRPYLTVEYWILCLLSCCLFTALDCFLKAMDAVYQEHFVFSSTVRTLLNQGPFFLAACLLVPFGLLMDRVGCRIIFLLVSALIVLGLSIPNVILSMQSVELIHSVLPFLIVCNVSMVLVILFFFPALWSMLCMLVAPWQAGVAFGVHNGLVGIVMSLTELLREWFMESFDNTIAFILATVFGFFVALLVGLFYVIDRRRSRFGRIQYRGLSQLSDILTYHDRMESTSPRVTAVDENTRDSLRQKGYSLFETSDSTSSIRELRKVVAEVIQDGFRRDSDF